MKVILTFLAVLFLANWAHGIQLDPDIAETIEHAAINAKLVVIGRMDASRFPNSVVVSEVLKGPAELVGHRLKISRMRSDPKPSTEMFLILHPIRYVGDSDRELWNEEWQPWDIGGRVWEIPLDCPFGIVSMHLTVVDTREKLAAAVKGVAMENANGERLFPAVSIRCPQWLKVRGGAPAQLLMPAKAPLAQRALNWGRSSDMELRATAADAAGSLLSIHQRVRDSEDFPILSSAEREALERLLEQLLHDPYSEAGGSGYWIRRKYLVREFAADALQRAHPEMALEKELNSVRLPLHRPFRWTTAASVFAVMFAMVIVFDVRRYRRRYARLEGYLSSRMLHLAVSGMLALAGLWWASYRRGAELAIARGAWMFRSPPGTAQCDG